MNQGPADSRQRPRRIGVISLGCSKNLVDTEVMLGHLDRAGWEFVNDPAEADVIVVNTCSFIDAAREESIRTILDAAQLKKTGKLQRLVVAGCMVQRYPDDLRRELAEADAFINLDELDQIVPRAGGPATTETPPPTPPTITSDLPLAGSAPWSAAEYLYDDRTPRRLATPQWTGYLKIAEGCDHTCSFCAIPSFRGKFRSRSPESVVREARGLANAGLRELNLIAQDSSHYGRDLGMREGLSELLERLDEIEELRWIRLHYLYPNTITDRLVQTMARLPRVLNYVDLPLQHAHPDMLKRMRRGGSGADHLRLLEKFRHAMPDAALRSTFIVGFPGETDEEFEALLEFVSAARFDHLGAFTYSHEEGTPAVSLTDDVPDEVKRERHDRLMELQQGIAFEHTRRMLGRTVTVLVEGSHPETEHLLVGRMSRQAPDVDGQVLINDGKATPGQFVNVELSETAGYDVVGGIVGPAQAR